MTTLIFPARSLRGRSASLRLFPERTRYSICKALIYHAFLVVGRTISGNGSIFLPALRETVEPSRRAISASLGNRDPNAIRPMGPAIDRGASPGCSLGPPVRRPAPSRATPAPGSLGPMPPATIALPDLRTLQRQAAFSASGRDAPRLCRNAIKRGLSHQTKRRGMHRIPVQRRPNRRSISARSSAT